MSIELSSLGELGEAIKAAINEACEKRMNELFASFGETDEAKAIREEKERILAKEFITAREASVLLSCSDSHIRGLVRDAKQGKDKRPIPFTPLGEDLTVFNTSDLLRWAKPYERAHLKIVDEKAA